MKRLILILLLINTSIFAVTHNYLIDNTRSSLQFLVSNLLLSTTQASIPSHNGSVQWNEDDPTTSIFTGTIASKNIPLKQTGKARRMLMDEMLAGQSLPQMQFISTAITKKGNSSYEVTGQLTVRGRSREITAPLKVGSITEDRLTGKKYRKFSTEFPLNPQDLRLRNTLLAGEKVVAVITLFGVESL